MPTLAELAAMHGTATTERDRHLNPRAPSPAAPERDPTGRAPSDPGAKLDDGKTRIGLMVTGFADALTAVAQVTTFGATKYTPGGWRTVPDGIDRYTDALYRHLLAHGRGEHLDPDSGLPHLAQAAWNCLAVLQLTLIPAAVTHPSPARAPDAPTP